MTEVQRQCDALRACVASAAGPTGLKNTFPALGGARCRGYGRACPTGERGLVSREKGVPCWAERLETGVEGVIQHRDLFCSANPAAIQWFKVERLTSQRGKRDWVRYRNS